MPARDHHSIGEVLALLQDDFPDITISKIRFLESQGLISPERTPSGYRRFFERDLERLRWILTQQRDHYLPLKVIREKLAAGEADAGHELPASSTDRTTGAEAVAEPAGETAPPSGPQATISGEPAVAADDAAQHGPAAGGGELDETGPRARTDEVEAEPPVAVPADAELGGEGLFAGAGPTATAEQAPLGDTVEVLEASEAVGASEPGEPAAPAEEQALEAAEVEVGEAPMADHDEAAEAVVAADAPADADAVVAADTGPETAAATESGEPGPAPTGGRRSGTRGKQRRTGPSKGKPQGGTSAAVDVGEAGEAPAAHDEASPDDGPRSANQRGAAPAARGRAPVDEPTVVALTRDELAEASGCPVPVLNDLERFGLLLGKTVGRGVLYDNDALVVARLAARFANHGLEPRHLRSFRLAAEREIGLFAQVVGPLLQRRDAMAHERAMETLSDLAGLASDLHQVLVQNLLSREFGNR